MFKHIATGLYLACDMDGKLSMTPNYDGAIVQWAIHAFKESEYGIQVHIRIRIRTTATIM